jgi:hypothetical protein
VTEGMRINNGKIMSIEDLAKAEPVHDWTGEPGICEENVFCLSP